MGLQLELSHSGSAHPSDTRVRSTVSKFQPIVKQLDAPPWEGGQYARLVPKGANQAWFSICTRYPQGWLERLCCRKARKGLIIPGRTRGDFSFFGGRMLKTLSAPRGGWGWLPVLLVGLGWAMGS